MEESEAAAPPRLTAPVVAAAADTAGVSRSPMLVAAAVDPVGVSRSPMLVAAATGALTLNAVALERGTASVEALTEDADRASTAARHRAEAQTMAEENLMVGLWASMSRPAPMTR